LRHSLVSPSGSSPHHVDPFLDSGGWVRSDWPACLPGYGYQAVAESQRRVDTLKNLEHMIETPVPSELRVAGVRRVAA
jgi:hypothetical protein